MQLLCLSEVMIDFIRTLNLEQKLSPRKNSEIIWFYLFFPCFVGYLWILTQFINSKPFIGEVEILHPSFEKLIYKGQQIEVIAEDLKWTEGPVWIQTEDASINQLVFSDTILNRIYKWEEGKGLFTVGKSIYIEKSGCKEESETYCNDMYEPGSNGLLRKSEKSIDIFACQHGDRAVSFLRENGTRSIIASHYRGNRLNSPNDLVFSAENHLYFTDPTYGLVNKNKEFVHQELNHSGIYMVKAEYVDLSIETGTPSVYVRLLDSSLNLPNGLAFSPDFSKLYVSNSDVNNPIWKVFDVGEDGSLRNGKVFYDGTQLYEEDTLKFKNMGKEYTKFAPDGFKVDIHGNLFASGPGGVIVLSPEGKLIGRFLFDRAVSNVGFGQDGRLYFTASDIVARIWIKSKPNRIVSK